MKKYFYFFRLLFLTLFGSKLSRYEAKFELLSGLAKNLGFRLYNKNLLWPHDEEYLNIWFKFCQSNQFIHDRRFNLYYLAKSVRALAGDTVECGVFQGAGSYLILSAQNNTHSTHHIFDSFEGLSEPEQPDISPDDRIRKWKPYDLSCSEQKVKENLNEYIDKIIIYKGWIPQRFSEVSDLKFKFVHVDVDLYQPTKDTLEFFYNRMIPGGLLVCDDFGFENCPGANKAFIEFINNKPEEIIHLTTGTGFIIKQDI